MLERDYSAAQVICLAAWGTTEPPSDAGENELRQRIAQRWGKEALEYQPIERIGGERRHWLVLAMRRTLIRCRWRLKHGQITAAKWPRLKPELAEARAEKWRSALRPARQLGRQRARVHLRHSQRPMAELMRELRADLRPLYALRGRQFEQLKGAISRIKHDILSGRIEAWGRAVEVGQEDRLGEYEVLPASYLVPEQRTITLDNKACCDPNAPLAELRSTQREWHQLHFRRADADPLYRPVTADDQGIPRSASSRTADFHAAKEASAEASLEDLPAYWTLGQSKAWIMFRNPALVHNVADIGTRHLDVLLALAEHENPDRALPDHPTAVSQLLTRLRAGDLHAKGHMAGRGGVQTMDPLDWVQGNLGEERDQIVVRVGRSGTEFWHGVMLPKDVVTIVWPTVSRRPEHEISTLSIQAEKNHLQLPLKAWIQAHHAFAWLAFGSSSMQIDINGRLKLTSDLSRDPELQSVIARLGVVADHVLSLLEAGTCSAYVNVAGTIEMRPLGSWVFGKGITVNILNGRVGRDNADLEAGRADYAALKAAGLNGVVWFKREELLNGLSVHAADPTEDANGHPSIAAAAQPELGQSAQMATNSHHAAQRPIIFAVHAAASRVVFGNGAVLTGAAFRLVSKLYETYTEDLRANRNPEDFRFVPPGQLADSLGVPDQTLRQNVARLRKNLGQQFARLELRALNVSDIIETRDRSGYRLNPHLAASPALIQASVDIPHHRHVTTLSADVTTWPD